MAYFMEFNDEFLYVEELIYEDTETIEEEATRVLTRIDYEQQLWKENKSNGSENCEKEVEKNEKKLALREIKLLNEKVKTLEREKSILEEKLLKIKNDKNKTSLLTDHEIEKIELDLLSELDQYMADG